ncbi:hypothetical protein C9994_14625 [Marivirga lumbricoides]|uniref:Uncharacterized protein n=1 Tax=Marivirga lumbricoides TaxID=1046115 RepID=A0A2T4DDW8_9BACT|nr:hypothetical protein C9994_14625 [Marivirga lumbricoides]
MKEIFIYKPQKWKQMIATKNVFLIFILSLGFINKNQACDCTEPDFVRSNFSSDLIFQGKLIGFEDTESDDVLAIFKITNIYKGNYSDSTIKVDGPQNLLNKKKSNISSCSWEGMKGVKYILYLQKDKEGQYQAGYCMRRVVFGSENWEKEIEWLNDSNINYKNIYFNYSEVDSKPFLNGLEKKLRKVVESNDEQNFIAIELKVNEEGKLVEANLINSTIKQKVEKIYDRYISAYDAYPNASTKLEKEVLKFAQSLKEWTPGQINDKNVNVKIKMVIYTDEASKNVRADLN